MRLTPNFVVLYLYLKSSVFTVRRWNFENIANIPTPSQAADKPNSCHDVAGGVYDGRPAGFYGPPNALFDRRLAYLADKLDNLDDVIPQEMFLELAAEYFKSAIQFYPQEGDRQKILMEILTRIFPNGHWQTLINSGKPEAFWVLALIFEMKNERGVKGDARVQAMLDYLKLLDDPNWGVR